MLSQQAPAKAATPKRGKGGKGDGKVLAQFCRDLCAEARAGRLDPVRRLLHVFQLPHSCHHTHTSERFEQTGQCSMLRVLLATSMHRCSLQDAHGNL